MKPLSEKKIALKKRNDKIAALYESGQMEIEELSEKFSLSPYFVSGILNKRGLLKRKNANQPA